MRHLVRPRLRLPAALAVSTLSLTTACPGGDDGDTGDDAATQTGTTSSGTTTGDTSTTSGGRTSTSDTTSATTSATTVDTGNTTGELPSCGPIGDEETCTAEPLCQWLFEVGCYLHCEVFDQAMCESTPDCEWFEGACYSPI